MIIGIQEPLSTPLEKRAVIEGLDPLLCGPSAMVRAIRGPFRKQIPNQNPIPPGRRTHKEETIACFAECGIRWRVPILYAEVSNFMNKRGWRDAHETESDMTNLQ